MAPIDRSSPPRAAIPPAPAHRSAFSPPAVRTQRAPDGFSAPRAAPLVFDSPDRVRFAAGTDTPKPDPVELALGYAKKRTWVADLVDVMPNFEKGVPFTDCCANFITAALMTSGRLDTHCNSTPQLEEALAKDGRWTRTDNPNRTAEPKDRHAAAVKYLKSLSPQIKPGDVVMFDYPPGPKNAHTVFFAGWEKDVRGNDVPTFVGANNTTDPSKPNGEGNQRITKLTIDDYTPRPVIGEVFQFDA